jgi:hypothetical protein
MQPHPQIRGRHLHYRGRRVPRPHLKKQQARPMQTAARI